MIINNDLAFNIICDFKKKDVSLEDKSSFIKLYLKEHNISQRELGKRFDIPHSTIQDWVSMRQKNKVSRIVINSKNFSNLDILIERVTFVISKEDSSSISNITRNRLELLLKEINKVLLK